MRKIVYFLVSLMLMLTATASLASQDKYREYQKYLGLIGYYAPVEASYKGDNIIVAVIDSGVWLQHPDFKGVSWINNKEISGNGLDDDNNGYIDDQYGWNFIDNNNDLTTKTSHGTAVAGIIAAQHNSIGLAGIAPNVKIMSLISCDDQACPRKSVTEAIKYAVDNGADIINLSLGGNGYVGYTSDYNFVIDYAFNKGVIIVAAAGNGDIESGEQTGQNLDFLKVSPACNDGGDNKVIGVGADADWSNYGSCVDIIAPGENIPVLGVPLHDSEYSFMNGTSFSAPMVAAGAALIKSAYPNLKNWEVIDKLIYYDRLNIRDSIMTEGRCQINSISKHTINSGDDIDFFGKHIFSKINFILVGNSMAMQVNSHIEHASANKFTLKTKKLNLAPGQYKLEVNGMTCDIDKNITFEVLKQDSNNVIIQKPDDKLKDLGIQRNKIKNIDTGLSNRLKGKILLQVESHGEAWYINPKNAKRYYMANGNEAYNIMRDLGIGITNADLNKIKKDNKFAQKNSGKIFLQVESLGQAFYIDFNGTAHYLKDGEAAYNIMRELGLGIKTTDLDKIEVN